MLVKTFWHPGSRQAMPGGRSSTPRPESFRVWIKVLTFGTFGFRQGGAHACRARGSGLREFRLGFRVCETLDPNKGTMHLAFLKKGSCKTQGALIGLAFTSRTKLG